MVSLDKRDQFPYPYSLDPLTPTFQKGLIIVGISALLSLISAGLLLGFITHRLISWRKHYKEYVGYNQYVVLIYNLLLADLNQAMAFVISFHWLRINKIVAPTVACFYQGWFIHLGDVSSGFFVLGIAIHTWLAVVKGYKMTYKVFVAVICSVWVAALGLTLVGPLMRRERFFTRAGGWCWVSVEYEPERLWLHYLWIFIVEFGTMGIYGHIFFHLRGRIKTVVQNDTSKLTRATKFMLLYPLVYVILTLPLAIGRMVAMSGKSLPDWYFCMAGSLLTSCGWIDALLYTITRRVLVSNELKSTGRGGLTSGYGPRGGDEYGLQSVKGAGDLMTSRTVTITGGRQRLSKIVDNNRGLGRSRGRRSPSLRESSPTGSTDSIIKMATNAIGMVTETRVEYESANSTDRRGSESDLNSPITLTPSVHSQSEFNAKGKDSDEITVKHG